MRTDNWHDWQGTDMGRQRSRCLRLWQTGFQQPNGCALTPTFPQSIHELFIWTQAHCGQPEGRA
eukprot:8545683-Pyramimonas_sp.AAC.1